MPARHTHKTFCLVLVCLTAVLLAPAVWAQTADESKPRPAADSQAFQPIPGSQISVKAQETESVLRSMRDGANPEPEIEKVGREVASALGDLQELLVRTRALLASSVSIRDFEDLQRRWAREKQRVDQWQSKVQRRAEALDQDLAQLQRGRRIWQITLETSDEAGIQEALVEVINSALAAVSQLEQQYGTRRAELLTIEEQIRRADDINDQAMSAIGGITRHPARFFGAEALPLWSLLAHLPPRARHVDALREAYEKGVQDLSLFAQSYRDALIGHAVLTLVVLVLLILLNRRARRLEADTPEIDAAKHTLSRPIAATIVVSIAGIGFYYPDAPRLIDDLAVIALIVPIFLLLPRGASRLRTPLIVLVVVSILSRFIDMLTYLSPLQRLATLVVSGGTGAYLTWILRKQTVTDGLDHTLLRRSMRTAELIAVVLLTASVVVNILGYFAMASVLLSGVLITSYIGVVYFLLYFVIAAVLWIGISSGPARRLRILEHQGSLIRTRLLSVTRLVLVILWFRVALDFLQVLPVVSAAVRRIFTAKIQFGEIGLSLLNLVAFAATIWAAFALSRFIRFVLAEDVYPRMWLPRGVANAISTSIHYVALLLGFFLAFAATGADLNKFAVLAGAFGVGLGFGLQNVVANFVAGLILIFERPIMTGDHVEVGTVIGVVKQIGLRSTTVRTLLGAEVIVPNGKLVAEEVTNWTLSDKQRRLDLDVGVKYGTDPQTVIELLIQVAAEHPDILDTPHPRALMVGFGDSSLNFQLRVWTLNAEARVAILSDLHVRVDNALKAAGIEIPFPQRDVHLRTLDDGGHNADEKKQSPKPDSKTDSES